MRGKYFIFRNFTIEPLFTGIDNCIFSDYGSINFTKDCDYYLWFYLFPLKANRKKAAEEIDFYSKNLEYIVGKLPETSTLICFTMVDNSDFYFKNNDPVYEPIKRYNDLIIYLSQNTSNVKAIDFAEFSSRYSRENIIDYRHFYLSMMPINPKLINDFRIWINQILNSLAGKRKKCLILDLDNTLWGGIIGEDGLAGIKLGNTYPGNCFLDFQEYIKEIKETGVILAICSKNNHNDVKEVFDKQNSMILNYDDFAIIKTNWKNKSENITQIAKELNIGLDSMVFIDDSSFEREQVNRILPEVETPDFPNKPYLLINFIKEVYHKYFRIYNLTDEDKDKTKQYKENELRNKVLREPANYEEIIKELNIKISISENDKLHIPRIAQMTQKTNQFNLTTKRYTEQDIRRLMDGNHLIFDASVSDKFGDNGITALAIVKINSETAHIDSFLLSCRILGRGIESNFLKEILLKLKEKGILQITAIYIPTEKNIQTKDFYLKNGFVLTEKLAKSEKYLKKL